MRLAGILRRPNADKAGQGFSRRGEFSTTGKAWEKYPQCGLPQGPSRSGRTAYPPLKKRGKLVSWTPENSDFVRGFVQSRKDQPVLLRSRAICRLSRIFSEIL